MKKSILFFSMILIAIVSLSFVTIDKKTIETSFWVNRDCEMCKAKILSAADIKGVKSASYDMETYMLTVVFNPAKVTIENIHQSIANAGYDTSLIKATGDAYNSLPGCCQYDRNLKPNK